MPRQCVVVCAFALLVLASAPAPAAPIEYGDYFGANPGDISFLQVAENSTTDPTPLFNAPIHLPNQLIFIPTVFASGSANGSADTTSGTLTMRIQADTGFFLELITIKEVGDYTLSGVGTPATSATVNGLLTLTDINPGKHGIMTDLLSVNPAPIYSLPVDSSGEFDAITQINLTGLAISEVVLNFNNNLQTTSEQGTTSFIQKKVQIVITPEPNSLSLLILGALMVRGRRRRRNPTSS
ncbi:MAG: PEP-CTERM sorting domain-containing protein [Planctomycetota bacterium]